MPVTPQLLPVTLRGLSQKSASNLAAPGELTRAENLQILKGGPGGFSLSKRYGSNSLATASDDPARSSFQFATHLATLGDSLVLNHPDTVAVFDVPANRWITHDKHGLGFSSDTDSVSESLYEKNCPTAAIDPNQQVEIFAWVDAINGASTGAVYYSVRSLGTGAWTAHEVRVTQSIAYVASEKIQAFAPGDGYFYLWFRNSATSELNVARIPVLQPLTYSTFAMSGTDGFQYDVQQTTEGQMLVACPLVGHVNLTVFIWDPPTQTIGLGTAYPIPTTYTISWLAQQPMAAGASRVFYLAMANSVGTQLVTFPYNLVAPTTTTLVTGGGTGVTNVTGYVEATVPVVFTDLVTVPPIFNQIQLASGTYSHWIGGVRFASRPFRIVTASGGFRWFALVRFDSTVQAGLFLIDLISTWPVAKVSVAGPVSTFYSGQGHLPYPTPAAVAPSNVANAIDWSIPFMAGHDVFANSVATPNGTQIDGIFTARFNAFPANMSAPAELANELHFPGSIPYVFDGANVREAGFNVFPEAVTVADSGAGSGMPATGTNSYRATYRRQDATGAIHESAPSVATTYTNVNAHTRNVTVPTLRLTNANDVFIDLWRNSVTQPAVYRKVNSAPVPNITTVDTITIVDSLAEGVFPAAGDWDARPELYTDSGALEHIAPSASRIVTMAQNRIFQAGIDQDPTRVEISNEWVAGDAVSYFDGLALNVQGDVTAMAARDRNVVVFTIDSITTLTGEYPDATGGGTGIPNPIRLPHGVGPSHRRRWS